MTLFEIGAILLCLAALFGYVNRRYLRLPNTIGLVLIAAWAPSARQASPAPTLAR